MQHFWLIKDETTKYRSFVRSLGAAVRRWQSFDVPSAYRQRWGAIPL